MPYYEYQWTDEIIDHLAEHDLTPEDFEDVASDPEATGISESSGSDCCFGETVDGRFIFCAYDVDADGITLIPRTAFEVPRRSRKR